MVYPLTDEDLIRIGNTVADVTNRLKTLEDGEKTEMLMPGIADVVVQILRPDALAFDDIVGEVRWHPDGWWAYYPREATD